MFFVSPRNNTAALLDLLEQATCNIFLMPADAPVYSNLLISVLEERPMQTFDIPELAYFLDEHGSVAQYTWNKTFEAAKHDPLAVFHTSGSTASPKLITVTHGTVACLDAFSKIPAMSGQMIQTSSYIGKRTLLFFPMFHASALSTLFLSIWNLVPTVLPCGPLTAELANDMLQSCNVKVAIMPPSILAEISNNQAYLGNLSKCESVMYGGGPLPTSAGDRISSGTNLITVFGSSETGFFPVEMATGAGWPYIKLSPYAGAVYRNYGGNLYELVIERKHGLEEYQAVFCTYPELQEYHTKDLFVKHAHEPDCWLWQGRIDDMIVLSTGEKFNPTSTEDMIINGHQAIESALVCGQGRFQCSLLIELSSPECSEDDKLDDEIMEELWPAIEKANENCPEYGRLMKDMVIIAKQGKRMIRADKGTVQRKRTLEHFAVELDQLYRLREAPTGSGSVTQNARDFDAVKRIITRIVCEIPRYRHTQCESNLLALGLDSLHAVTLARKINKAFPESPAPVTSQTIYRFCSIDMLSEFICGLAPEQEGSVQAMQTLYDRYSMTWLKEGPATRRSRAATVLLVGSTGHLGTQILAQLVHNQDVEEIYCLDRDPDADTNWRDLDLENNKVLGRSILIRHIHADSTKPHLGITEEEYAHLQKRVTHVIHNAWPVDFCKPLSHFECSIKTTMDLMRLCDSAEHATTFIFVSTIGSVLGQAETPVPEEVVDDWLAAEKMGYTQSKLIAERLVAASATSRVKSVICRMGQLGGVADVKAWGEKVPAWPRKEWLPAMLASSLRLGAIPCNLVSLERVDWLPVDVAATVLLELAFTASAVEKSCQVFNVVKPRPNTWATLLPSLKQYARLENVSLGEWVVRLKRSVDGAESLPAAGLIEFFESVCRDGVGKPAIETSKANALSVSLTNAQPITVKLMERWICEWDFNA
jgi:thioester reductase-like protein